MLTCTKSPNIYSRFIAFTLVQGVPYNVTVFATNGRGKGLAISGVYFAVEDG